MDKENQHSQQVFKALKPEPWWLLPAMSIGLTGFGLWQMLQCLIGSHRCRLSNLDPFWSVFVIAVGLSACSYLYQQWRSAQFFGNVTLRLNNPPARPGKAIDISLCIEKNITASEQIIFGLVRQDGASNDFSPVTLASAKNSAENQSSSANPSTQELEFSTTLQLPDDLKIRRSSDGAVASFIVTVKAQNLESIDWQSAGSGFDPRGLIRAFIAWLKFNVSGSLAINHEFLVPWQILPTNYGEPQGHNADTNRLRADNLKSNGFKFDRSAKKGEINATGQLSNGTSWKTNNKDNQYVKGNWTAGSFLWQSKALPVADTLEVHVLSRHYYDDAKSKLDTIQSGNAGLAALSAHVLSQADKENNAAIVLGARNDLTVCELSNFEFENRFVILTNQPERTRLIFDQATTTPLLDFAEAETKPLQIKLQNTLLVVQLSHCDISQHVAELWIGLSVQLGNRVLAGA